MGVSQLAHKEQHCLLRVRGSWPIRGRWERERGRSTNAEHRHCCFSSCRLRPARIDRDQLTRVSRIDLCSSSESGRVSKLSMFRHLEGPVTSFGAAMLQSSNDEGWVSSSAVYEDAKDTKAMILFTPGQWCLNIAIHLRST